MISHPKALFSIANTLRCKEGFYSFLWFDPLTLDLYLIMPRIKQGGIFGMTQPGIDLWSPKPLANITTPDESDATGGQFLNVVKQVWIQSFPFPRLVVISVLKSPACPIIYP